MTIICIFLFCFRCSWGFMGPTVCVSLVASGPMYMHPVPQRCCCGAGCFSCSPCRQGQHHQQSWQQGTYSVHGITNWWAFLMLRNIKKTLRSLYCVCHSCSQSGRPCRWSWSSGWCVFASWRMFWCSRLSYWYLLLKEQQGALHFSAPSKHCWREEQVRCKVKETGRIYATKKKFKNTTQKNTVGL